MPGVRETIIHMLLELSQVKIEVDAKRMNITARLCQKLKHAAQKTSSIDSASAKTKSVITSAKNH